MGSSDTHWRESQRELHLLNAKVSSLIAGDTRRKLWLDFLAEYLAAIKTGEDARKNWEQLQREYFEREVFSPGKSYLRDRTIVPEDLYPGDYGRKFSAAEFAEIPRAIRKASYWDWERNDKGAYRKKAHMCFHAFAKDGKENAGGSLYVAAWIPKELIRFNEALLCHDPLPPKDIGRGYSLPEICYGLTVLHDIDGSFGPIVPPDSQLAVDLGHRFALAIGSCGNRATDEWVPSLESLLQRLQAELASRGKGPGHSNSAKVARKAVKRGRRSDTDHAEDRRIYEAWRSGQHSTYAALAKCRGKGEKADDIERAKDRHEKRLKRAAIVESPPDK